MQMNPEKQQVLQRIQEIYAQGEIRNELYKDWSALCMRMYTYEVENKATEGNLRGKEHIKTLKNVLFIDTIAQSALRDTNHMEAVNI